MRKTPTLFLRDQTDRRYVTDELNPRCQWVLAGEGVATRKYDGTACLIRDGQLFKRFEVKRGKTPPAGFEPADDVDPVTGKQPGWLPVADGAEDIWHREAMSPELPDGTYELVGPKVQGNPERFEKHTLVPHGEDVLVLGDAGDFDGLRDWLLTHEYEGIVWHHPDGRMAKLKRRDLRRA